jgi:hypothetical protein
VCWWGQGAGLGAVNHIWGQEGASWRAEAGCPVGAADDDMACWLTLVAKVFLLDSHLQYPLAAFLESHPLAQLLACSGLRSRAPGPPS